ncbi:MAG TPA: hypothetical protein PKH26_14650, partial [Phycisphaerae bacterium]|nr:hypothetical protein [Phycisphaerae bacterium]
MKPVTPARVALPALWLLVVASSGWAQITSNEGDGVLNAPYRGTIEPLRAACMDIPYGEVQSHVEPIVSSLYITSSTVDVWVEGTWDRSVLRLYEGLDASSPEIDLTGTSQYSPATVYTDVDSVKRFSVKAIGTKTLAKQTFTIRFYYRLNNTPVTPTRMFTVAPITGSFGNVPGESEAFLPGMPILSVAVGNARLTVPVGRTAQMIGAAFIEKDDNLGPTGIDNNDVVFPGAAESLYIQNYDQFRLGSSQAAKTGWGTPWPGYLIGYHIDSDPFGPDGTHYDSQTPLTVMFRRVDCIRPLMQDEYHPAAVVYVYDNDVDERVVEIHDQATTPNVITLQRTGGVVTRVSTSDGRGWNIQSDPAEGWITGIVPDGGKGARYFTYTPDPADPEAVPRVAQVMDAQHDLMYQFDYQFDVDGVPIELAAEKHFVDGALQTVVEHQIVSDSLRRRKEYVGPGAYRQYDFAYDTAGGLKHRLASITAYGELNGAGPAFSTTFTHNVNSSTGSMAITHVDLPDGTDLDHEYDSHVGGQMARFGLRTKTTRTGPHDGALVTFDADYEFFYTSGGTRLYFSPRIVKQRDGRGAISEVVFDYDNGGEYVDGFTDVQGQDLNRLLSITGPVINSGPSAPRTPQTVFIYNDYWSADYWLHRRELKYDAGNFRAVEYARDELWRVTSETVDPGGENIITRYLYCDTAPTQDRITVDGDGYWTRARFDNDGRLTTTQQFLNANAGNLGSPCADPAGPVYATTNMYDTNGRLSEQVVENKDQDGASMTPATISTTFSYDRLGRLEVQTVDPGGVGQQAHFDYNWLGDVERTFDTTGRGSSRTYDGRGLLTAQTPLALGATPDTNLTVTLAYDAAGNLRFTYRPTGAIEEQVYDDFDRPKHSVRHPGPDGGNIITTTFTYDAANNITRTLVEEATVGALSDSTNTYDEGGFNYESRGRTLAGVNGATDPVTQRRFDWSGRVLEERSLGDATVADRVLTTQYDGAGRVWRVLDSAGGERTFTRDDRGNVTEQTVKIDVTNSAVTTTVYDALSRAMQITDPEDGTGGRPDRVRRYDSRGNLLRESLRDASDVPRVTTVFGFDNAGRQTRRAVLASAAATTPAGSADAATDRVLDVGYDADGRVLLRTTYNNHSVTPLSTVTTYDALGRVDRVTDPAGAYTEDDYALNGRLVQRVVFDGPGLRTFLFNYDGHDRVTQQIAVGPPALVSSFQLDGLDRQVRVMDPRGIITRTDFDLVGRRIRLVEDEGGALARPTQFAYNRLGQLITQTAQNAANDGTPLPGQVTTFRYDSLGRQTRAVYPDSPDHADPQSCTDCVRLTYDLAGRLTGRTDQRGLSATLTYDGRGLLLTRTTGTARDTFAYDGVGRVSLALRGTLADPDATAATVRAYTDLGDLDYESQAIAGGVARTVNYDHDQGGNRLQMVHPAGQMLAYTPTVLNQVDRIDLNLAPFVDYDYLGRLLDGRRTITSQPDGNTAYDYQVGYDAHRRMNGISNLFQPGRGGTLAVVAYALTHDDGGNPLTQTATEGMPGFVGDDRVFSVDRLSRLTATEYLENGQVESSVFDRVGNRESHVDRAGTATTYTLANAANEYATVGGSPVAYDAAGNLTQDEDGRHYVYDEQNRLTQVRAADDTVLANYAYDAFGRRIMFEDPVAGTTTRYYYDGQNVIEERDGGDALVRYHVHGSQFLDERVATYDVAKAAASGNPSPPG